MVRAKYNSKALFAFRETELAFSVLPLADFDEQLLEQIRITTGDGVCVESIKCRLHINKINEIHLKLEPDASESLRKTVDAWHRCIRMLFSDEAVSLRNVKAFAEAFSITDPQKKQAQLRQLLLQKMPFVGEFCAAEVVTSFLALQNQLDNLPWPNNCSAISLLVHASLRDKGDKLWSYPEFLARFPRSHELHPILRLAIWIVTVFESAGESRQRALELPLQSLLSLDLMDQVIFPKIISYNGSEDVRQCLALSKSGDYSDLKWLADIVVRGYSVNWEKVKLEWQQKNIMHSDPLERLVSCCPVRSCPCTSL